MNGGLQTGGFVLAFLSFLCACVAIFLPEWQVNDPRGEIIEALFYHQGLWSRCIAQATGQWQCDDWDAKFLGLPSELQVARGLSIICVMLGMAALVLSIFGLECSACLQDAMHTKARVSQVAAALWMISALCIGVAVSFFAHQIATAFNISASQQASGGIGQSANQRWVFGTSIFLGWAALILGLLGGLVMLCGSFYTEDEDDYLARTRVGRGVRRMRESFRESYRALRPRPAQKDVDYV